MENVIPGALQRLRAADIIRMAGLTAASSGQEYCRAGAVHSTQRRGAHLSGTVDVPLTMNDLANSLASESEELSIDAQLTSNLQHYHVEVELQSATSWVCNCPCSTQSTLLCAHGAALLYQWLARPIVFVDVSPPVALLPALQNASDPLVVPAQSSDSDEAALPPTGPIRTGVSALTKRVQLGPATLVGISSILSQLGLSEMRGIAREYGIVTTGLTKGTLTEALLDALKQPEAIRHVASTLEKTPRQLLAVLTLAGGTITDDDLRGLFERFSLGKPGQLQSILMTLQSKGLLFRTSLNSMSSSRGGLNGALLDIGWYVPAEVQSALHVAVPITTVDVEHEDEKTGPLTLQLAGSYDLLADLLLVVRSLDGTTSEVRRESTGRGLEASQHQRSLHATGDGSIALAPPEDQPPDALISMLRGRVKRPAAFLRFAVRQLRLADMLYQDENTPPYLRALPGAAELLLGPGRVDALRDLFELWLTRSSYYELFDLQEEHLRVRCRATSLAQPMLRSGELEAENAEARQTVMALLAQVPLNRWISFSAFARFIYRLNPLFLQRRQRLFSSPHWWIEYEEGHPLRPTALHDWLRADMRYLARLFEGPLHWWGICDLAFADDKHLHAFRLTPRAGWLLNGVYAGDDLVPEDYPTRFHSLEVIDSEEVLVACSSDAWQIIRSLEMFAESAGVRRNRLCYRITPKALGDALSRGQRASDFLQLLRSLLTSDTGQDSALLQIVTRLEQWIANYGRVRLYTGVALLETTDTLVMRELSATTSLDELRVRSIHPTVVILKRAALERLPDELKRRGQSPLVHDEEVYGPE